MTADTSIVRQRLEALQEALTAWQGIYTFITEPCREAPFLEVRNLQLPMRGHERISVEDEIFVTGLGRKFGPADDPDKAALAIVMVMREDD